MKERVSAGIRFSTGRVARYAYGTRALGTPPGAFVVSGTSKGLVREVPTGKVKWYDAEKGFGFVTQDGGADVYIRKAALPQGVEGLKAGQRLEFGVADGRRGPQALSVRLLDPPPSVAEARRRPAEELHGLIEDMIKLLELKVQPDLRRNRYPDRKNTKQIAEIMRAVARDLDP